MIQKIINLNKWYDKVEEPWRFLLLILVVPLPQIIFDDMTYWAILMMILVIFRMISIYYKK
jgi:flagellar biosynthesis component FlhA